MSLKHKQCILHKIFHVATIDGYEDVPTNDEKSLQKATAHQPISVAIEVGGRDFRFYKFVSVQCFRFCLDGISIDIFCTHMDCSLRDLRIFCLDGILIDIFIHACIEVQLINGIADFLG